MKQKGFTLLEILLVVGIIAILTGIVIVAINPSKQLGTARNTERKLAIGEINKAVQQYVIKTGHYPSSITTDLTEICKTDNLSGPQSDIDCTGLIDLSVLVPDYLPAIPTDPQSGQTNGTSYQIQKDTNNQIAMSVTGAELGATITIGAPTGGDGGGGGGPDITTGLVLHYKFNDNAGNTTVADSASSNDGTATRNTSAFHTAGLLGGAFDFANGSPWPSPAYYLQFGSSVIPTGNTTVSMWAYRKTPTGAEEYWFYLGGSGNFLRFAGEQGYGNHNYYLYYNSTNYLLGDSSFLPSNQWTHLAFVLTDGTNVKVYKNGVLVTTLGSPSALSNSGTSYVGQGNAGGGDWWSAAGKIDDFRIYNRALSGDDVNALYNGGAGTED